MLNWKYPVDCTLNRKEEDRMAWQHERKPRCCWISIVQFFTVKVVSPSFS